MKKDAQAERSEINLSEPELDVLLEQARVLGEKNGEQRGEQRAYGRLGAFERWQGRHTQDSGEEDLPPVAKIGRDARAVTDVLTAEVRKAAAAQRYAAMALSPQPDPRDAMIADLQRQVMANENRKAFDELRRDFSDKMSSLETKIANVQAPAKDNGPFSDKLIALLLDRALERQDPKTQLEQLGTFSAIIDSRAKAVANISENAVHIEELRLRGDLAKVQRLDAKEIEVARLEAEKAQHQESMQKTHDLFQLASKTVSDAVSPVLKSIGDGFEQKIAGNAALPQNSSLPSANVAPAAEPPPESFSPQDRMIIEERLRKHLTRGAEYLRRLEAIDAAEAERTTSPPVEPEPEPAYGETVRRGQGQGYA